VDPGEHGGKPVVLCAAAVVAFLLLKSAPRLEIVEAAFEIWEAAPATCWFWPPTALAVLAIVEAAF
jgi:hypothetical protein